MNKYTDQEMETYLLQLNQNFKIAVNNKDFTRIKQYALEGADIHDGYEWPLRMLCSEGHLELVTLLFKLGANILIDNNEPFKCATLTGKVHVMEFLMQHGADIRNNNDEPLRMAAEFGELDSLIFLKNNGVELSLHHDYLLTSSTRNGHVHILSYLKNEGFNLHFKNDEILYTAAKYGHLAVVKFLILDCDADISVLDTAPLGINAKRWYNENKESIYLAQILKKELSQKTPHVNNKKIKI